MSIWLLYGLLLPVGVAFFFVWDHCRWKKLRRGVYILEGLVYKRSYVLVRDRILLMRFAPKEGPGKYMVEYGKVRNIEFLRFRTSQGGIQFEGEAIRKKGGPWKTTILETEEEAPSFFNSHHTYSFAVKEILRSLSGLMKQEWDRYERLRGKKFSPPYRFKRVSKQESAES